MTAKYWQKGETLDYTAATAVGNGDIVDLATRVGVAGNNIPAGSTGAVHVEGVFIMPKGSDAITLGAAVYWDAAEEQITTTAEGHTPAGYAAAPADTGAATVLVKLLG